jgi:branched-chain amino acid transport system ATP-binding protein
MVEAAMSGRFLVVERASRRFAGLVAVDQVSLTLARGEILSLIGPNGAGKTTLFNLITGQLKPSAGEIVFRDARIDHLPPHVRAQRGMGRTFQIAKPLTGLTARENVMVGAFLRHRSHTEAFVRANEVLAEVGLDGRADLQAAELTLSERRRLEVARALALEPELVLLDEVMAGLNATEVTRVIELILRLNARGIAFLVIEHNLKVVREMSQRVIVLDHGAKIAEGSAADVLSDPQVVRAYLGNRRAGAA